MTEPKITRVTEAETKAPVQYGHKNPPIGPATSKPLPEWRKTRDYEQFNPTPEK
jgi:hypothetical protein